MLEIAGGCDIRCQTIILHRLALFIFEHLFRFFPA
jgi:hypothetical protein